MTDFDVVFAAPRDPKTPAVRTGLELHGLRPEGGDLPEDLPGPWIDTGPSLVSRRCAK